MSAIKCCKDCTDRHVGCHSTCKRYIDEKAAYEEKQVEVRKKKHNEYLVTGYEIDTVHRMKKSYKFVCNKK